MSSLLHDLSKEEEGALMATDGLIDTLCEGFERDNMCLEELTQISTEATLHVVSGSILRTHTAKQRNYIFFLTNHPPRDIPVCWLEKGIIPTSFLRADELHDEVEGDPELAQRSSGSP